MGHELGIQGVMLIFIFIFFFPSIFSNYSIFSFSFGVILIFFYVFLIFHFVFFMCSVLISYNTNFN
jgi:hypothetical protein